MSIKRKIQAQGGGRRQWRSGSAGKADWPETEVRSLVQRNRRRRLELARDLYIQTAGNAECPISLAFLCKPQQKLSTFLADVLQLEAQGLVMFERHNKPAESFVGLTHQGVNAVENMYPDQTKSMMPEVVFVEGDGSTVQIGPNNSATITQNFGFDAAQVLQLLKALRSDLEKLSKMERREAAGIVDALEQETQSAVPDNSKIKALVSQLGYFAIKSSTQGAITTIIQLLVQAVNA